MKSTTDMMDAPKQVKWLRCLQCNQKFPEPDFKAHQRASKSPCELVSQASQRPYPVAGPNTGSFSGAPRSKSHSSFAYRHGLARIVEPTARA